MNYLKNLASIVALSVGLNFTALPTTSYSDTYISSGGEYNCNSFRERFNQGTKQKGPRGEVKYGLENKVGMSFLNATLFNPNLIRLPLVFDIQSTGNPAPAVSKTLETPPDSRLTESRYQYRKQRWSLRSRTERGEITQWHASSSGAATRIGNVTTALGGSGGGGYSTTYEREMWRVYRGDVPVAKRDAPFLIQAAGRNVLSYWSNDYRYYLVKSVCEKERAEGVAECECMRPDRGPGLFMMTLGATAAGTGAYLFTTGDIRDTKPDGSRKLNGRGNAGVASLAVGIVSFFAGIPMIMQLKKIDEPCLTRHSRDPQKVLEAYERLNRDKGEWFVQPNEFQDVTNLTEEANKILRKSLGLELNDVKDIEGL